MMTTIELTSPETRAAMDQTMAKLDALPDEGFVLGYVDGEFYADETFSGEPLFAATVFEDDTEAASVPWYGPDVDRDRAPVMNMKQAKAVAFSTAFDACVKMEGWMDL